MAGDRESSKKYYDLFECCEEQPVALKMLLDKYDRKFPSGMFYPELNELQKEVEAIGFTFDFGLDATPYGLRPLGVELDQLEDI